MADEKVDLKKLLVLRGPALEAGGILSLLRERFDVEVAQSLDDALAAMRRRPFDAVLAETADFLPLERGFVTQQAAAVLDTLGDGVCIVGSTGELVWANRRLKGYPPAVLGLLRGVCLKAYQQFAASSGGKGVDRGRRFSLMPDDGTYYEVICSPVCDAQGTPRQVAAVVVNATLQRRQQLKLNAIDRAGRELGRLDYEALAKQDAPQRLAVLEERIIRGSREVLNYPHFDVYLLDERTNRLEAIISEGMDGERGGELFATSEGNGTIGYVAATGRSYICPDVERDARYVRGLGHARSSLTVPLRLHDKIIGVMNVESDKPGAFSEEDRQFAEIFANYVAMALHVLNLVVFAGHRAQTVLTGSIAAELTGPLNDVVTELSSLVEDYIGHDDLRRRLGEAIDRADHARRTLQQLAAGPSAGVVGAAGPIERDPALTGRRILVADDEAIIRTTIRDVLSPYGCLVDLASDGTEATAMIERQRYDLVISDIKMPGATGYDVFQAARTVNPSTKVILITGFGYDPYHSIVRANREGLSAVLFKPFKARQLLDQCREALAGTKR